MTTQKRQTIAQQYAEMRRNNMDHIKPSVERWLKDWTEPYDRPSSMTVTEAYQSWDHWDDHIRYEDHGCVPDSAHDGLPHDYMPTRAEFSEILTELGVPKRRVGKGIRVGIRPTNPFCDRYFTRPFAK